MRDVKASSKLPDNDPCEWLFLEGPTRVYMIGELETKYKHPGPAAKCSSNL